MFYYKNLKIDAPSSVYFPREDSLLLAETLKEMKLKDKNILEVGCGSGFLSILAASLGAQITAIDINLEAISSTLKNAKNNNVKLTAFQSDLFSNITNKFDLIFFNPPYLPDKDNIDGKETWSEKNTISRFIKQAKTHLNPNGTILLLISSLTQTPARDLLQKQGFSVKILAKNKVPWEELLILSARQEKLAAKQEKSKL